MSLASIPLPPSPPPMQMATGVNRQRDLLSRPVPDITHNHEQADIDGTYPNIPIAVLDRLIPG